MRELGYVARDDKGRPLDKDGELVTDEAENEPDVLYTFHGLRKNAACYMKEVGLEGTQIGLICGMSPDTVRHYTKQARALIVARDVAARLAATTVVQMGR
ncbi:hypothetical protein [Sphingomonas sp. DT-204]|uniref:hypothetical protein n=1 Tax=Sphingomonas sp. DT-204 TaxID=3396166 RepID=UPI003F1AC5D7